MAARDRFVVVAVAASAGGIPAIGEMLASLPSDLPAAILIIQHLAPGRPSVLANILRRFTTMPVHEAHEADTVRCGEILVAPPGRHMAVTEDGAIKLTEQAPVHFVRPAADLLFDSVALTYGPRALAIVLSGTGEDGAKGVRAIKLHGGTVFVQHGTGTAFFDGMPSAAIQTGIVDAVLSIKDMSPAISALVDRLSTS